MLEEIRQIRIEKLKSLQAKGINSYPAKSAKAAKISEILNRFDGLADEGKAVVTVGRLIARREHGASSFGNIEDFSGNIQLYFKKDILGEDIYEDFIKYYDIGDFLEISGILFLTKKGEKTIEVHTMRVLAKSILPLPEKWHGLQDIDERFRKRYLDLIMSKDVRNKFLIRSKIIASLQNFLNKNDFLNVETPMLQTLPGGAAAKPFKTKLNALDLDLYLRIAPELYLKRLLVGGFEKIYEIGRCFRNEGMDSTHNPEFTMLEFYWAYQDYEGLMDFTEKMLQAVLKDIFGKSEIFYEDKKIDFSNSWYRMDFCELIKEVTGFDYFNATKEDLLKKAKELGIKMAIVGEKGKIADEIFKKIILPKIIQPTFIVNHPIEISPLAKKHADNPDKVERFQVVVAGRFELVNAFSELNDPLDQRERFEAQEKMRRVGDEESHRMDEDFIESLEYGMPPAAGLGMGIDRLAMLLTDSHSMREVIFFPTMRPRSDN